MVSISLVSAQTKTASGRVISSEDGEPVIGAGVYVKGSNQGASTDLNGQYSITVPASTQTLVVSYVGMKTVEVPAEQNVTVSLQNDDKTFDEIIVTAAGIKRSEKSLGYAVSSVDPEGSKMTSQPDFLKSLQGKVAGVDIRSSQGTPGAATRINIRGNSSFYGSSEPLIIVDGVPLSNEQVTTSSQTSGGGAYSNGFSSLDPNDIASMSVLKGSAASALYGSRASNGVIIIKTKSGSIGLAKRKTEITVNSSVSWESIANLPDYQNSYGAGANFTYSNSNGSWGPKFGTLDSIPLQNNAWFDNYPELFPQGKKIPYKAYPNNVKDLFRTGSVYDNSVNFSGGTGKTGFNATLSNLTHNGYVRNSNYNRNSMSVGGSSILNNGITIKGSVSYTNTDQLGSVFGENQVEGATSSFARSLFLARNWDIAGLPYETLTGLPISTNNSQYDNPLWAVYHNTVKTKVDRAMANFGMDYQITPWIGVSYQLGSNLYSLNRREVIDIGSRALSGLGQLTTDAYRSLELESNLLVTLQKDFNDFSTRLVLGNNVNQRSTSRFAVKGSTFNVPNIFTLGNTKSQSILADGTSKRRLIGAFADLTLGYKSYLFLNLTGRNDWSSTLPNNSRSYFYPAIATSFIFSDAFDITSDYFSFGKIRAGWAKVGNDASPYSINDTYVILDPFKGQSRARLGYTAHDPNLQPEFTEEIELGTQLEFFQRRLAFDLTWYRKLSSNQIASLTLPPSSGYGSYYTNFGKIENKGIELDVNAKIIKQKYLNWDLHVSFTKNKNTVLELIEGVDRIQLDGVLTDISPYLEPGKPFGYLRGTKNYRDELGNLLIDPGTGLLIPNPEPEMVGDPNPDFKMGIGTTLSYKGAFLSAHFDWTQGGDIYSVTINSLLGRGVTKDTEDREHTWVIPGYYGDPNTGKPILDANGNKIPNTTQVTTNDLYFGNSFAINSETEFNIYDATVYRFRDLTIGYELPKKLLNKTPFGNVIVSISGQNLWYFAPNVPKYTKFDPEVNSFGSTTTQGIELSAAPTTRRFGVNLKLTF